MTVSQDDNEIWLVFYWGDLVAVVGSERMAENLCLGPDHMTWKRFVVGGEPE